MDGILRVNRDGQYGFIQPLRGRPDEPLIFAHRTSFVDGCGCAGIPIGTRVSFKIAEGRDGKPIAAQVRIVALRETTGLPRDDKRRLPDRRPGERFDLSA